MITCEACGCEADELWYLPLSHKLVCVKCYSWAVNEIDDIERERELNESE